MTKQYDLIVIGAGPGGCVNHGCIPTKVLLHSAKIFATMQDCAGFGVCTDNLSFDFTKMQTCKDNSVTQYLQGIEQAFEDLNMISTTDMASYIPIKKCTFYLL